MSEGRGGFWNRAARRSGGNRPVALEFDTLLTCACGAELRPGLLEKRIIPVDGIAHEIALCPGCKGVVRADGKWLVSVPHTPGDPRTNE